ncbi:peptidase domain-containing ABC transporter [Chitinophaga sp. 22536]|uniref:peptidase domain-containing ABC transporter n=1 Tax=unclassified Chitinophaga TaxID=2619133 RepID=UPI003F82E9AD
MSFQFYKQANAKDCGATCIRMIAKYYGKNYSMETLRNLTGFNRGGVSMLALSKVSEKIGLRPRAVQMGFDDLSVLNGSPCILHWQQNHFIVFLKKSKSGKVKIADPGGGIIWYTKQEFLDGWIAAVNKNKTPVGTALLIEVSPRFYQEEDEEETKLDWTFFFSYLKLARKQIYRIFAAFVFGLLLQMIAPFIMQSTIDIGINGRNFGFIKVIIIAQLVMLISSTIVNFIQSRVSYRMSNILNISILSDFWIKLSRLPISYFDKYHTGDTLKRLGDHGVIQGFMTSTALGITTSVINFIIYSVILLNYSIQLFTVFVLGNLVYSLWIRLFLGVRRKLNYQSFELGAKAQNMTIQMIQGMQEIKLNNAEQVKRWDWEKIQAAVFKFGFKSMDYNQIQSAGGLLISQSKDILLTLIVSKQVIDGTISLGTMVAVQYIIGQLSGPVSQFIGYIQSTQDAKISLERLNDIHKVEEEEPSSRQFINTLPDGKDIQLKSLCFSYPGSDTKVLDNINLSIPIGKITAIVGVSGGGKTTLLKILMKSYYEYEGSIEISQTDFQNISPSYWRSISGVVQQDGYIFNESISQNIALGSEAIDTDKLIKCCRIANILSFIQSLPNGFNTKLGTDGVGISQGQRQRMLIARALYKDPRFIFFDEATNALDANNEKEIIENLNDFFDGRTVVVVAHRLSTIRNADKIIVLHQGTVAEEGTHEDLYHLKGRYYELVKNQFGLKDVVS